MTPNLSAPSSIFLCSARAASPQKVMLPLLWSGDGALNSSQAELLTRLIKGSHLQHLTALITAIVRADDRSPACWTESQLIVIQAILSRRPGIDAATILALFQQCDAQVDVLRRSLKFSNMVFTLIRLYHAEILLPHLPLVRRTVEKLETFLRKSALTIIDDIEARSMPS